MSYETNTYFNTNEPTTEYTWFTVCRLQEIPLEQQRERASRLSNDTEKVEAFLFRLFAIQRNYRTEYRCFRVYRVVCPPFQVSRWARAFDRRKTKTHCNLSTYYKGINIEWQVHSGRSLHSQSGHKLFSTHAKLSRSLALFCFARSPLVFVYSKTRPDTIKSICPRPTLTQLQNIFLPIEFAPLRRWLVKTPTDIRNKSVRSYSVQQPLLLHLFSHLPLHLATSFDILYSTLKLIRIR